MRTLATLLFLTLFGSTFAQVPDYLDNNPQWRQEWWFGYSYPCLEIYNYIYYLNGDSIVDGQTYKKVFQRDKVEHSWMGPPPSYQCEGTAYYNYFRGLVRQDGRKMYLRDFGNEFLLYDFGLSVGDTLPTTYNTMQTDILVTGIDSLMVGNSYRKVFHLNNWPDNILIEGIGFDTGFLDQFPDYEFPANLMCFTLNDTTYYPAFGDPCDLTVDVASLDLNKEIQFYPNPVFDNLTIDLPANSIINQVFAYNILGNEILLDFKQENISQLKVDFSDAKKGLYFLKLITDSSAQLNLKVVK